MKSNNWKELTMEEKKVIEDGETEAPFTGIYNDFFNKGVYRCKRCGAELFASEHKFKSDCGWPSFDDAKDGAIIKIPDSDGKRTEIRCANCGAHLGHVFATAGSGVAPLSNMKGGGKGEGMTEKNRRYCVNSISLDFEPEKESKLESIVLGGGCFWCTEAVFDGLKGVRNITAGYAGGWDKNPDYEHVATGRTGHAEVIKIDYDPDVIKLKKILEIFFQSHDPTSLNRQGNDIGTQYRSAIYWNMEDEKKEIKNFLNNIVDKYRLPIVTEVKKLNKFYPAEKYHQNYYKNHPESAYCARVITPKLKKIKNTA